MELLKYLRCYPLSDSILHTIEEYLITFETDIPHQKEYENYWINPFPEGKQSIYVIFGNSDSSDFHTALCANIITDYLPESSFICYQDLAEVLYKNREDCDLFSLIDYSYDDDDIPIEDNHLLNLVKEAKSPLDLFTKIVNYTDTQLDPVLMIREHNPLLTWLIDKRNI